MDDKENIEELFEELADGDGGSGSNVAPISIITRGLLPPIIVLGCLLILGDFPIWIGFVSLIVACFGGVAWGITFEKANSRQGN